MPRYAVVCPPSPSVVNGLRMNDLGEVSFSEILKQHQEVCLALEGLGFSLIYIPSNEKYPDSVFPEDPAVIIEDQNLHRHTLVVSRLYRSERWGEEGLLLNEIVPRFFNRAEKIVPPGFLEGGDTLVCPELKHLFIGLSKRTNESGAEQLAKIARDHNGYKTHIFKIPETYLHLKGEVTFHPDPGGLHTITVSEEIVREFLNIVPRLIVTYPDERFAGNSISIGKDLVMRSGAPKTKATLEKYGYSVTEVDISQFMLIDGALTCLWKKIPEIKTV